MRAFVCARLYFSACIRVCNASEYVSLPDVEGGVEDVGLLQAVQLNLAVSHLVVHTLQLVIQLQLLPLELTVLLLVPGAHRHTSHTHRPGEDKGLICEIELYSA